MVRRKSGAVALPWEKRGTWRQLFGGSRWKIGVAALALVGMIGWLLVIGQPIILPVVMAIIAVYVLTTAAEALGRVPVIGRLPGVARHGLVLLGFTLAAVALALVVTVTLEQLTAVIPRYQSNLETLIARAADIGGIEHPTWDDIVEATLGKMNLQAILLRTLGDVRLLEVRLHDLECDLGADRLGADHRRHHPRPHHPPARLARELADRGRRRAVLQQPRLWAPHRARQHGLRLRPGQPVHPRQLLLQLRP